MAKFWNREKNVFEIGATGGFSITLDWQQSFAMSSITNSNYAIVDDDFVHVSALDSYGGNDPLRYDTATGALLSNIPETWNMLTEHEQNASLVRGTGMARLGNRLYVGNQLSTESMYNGYMDNGRVDIHDADPANPTLTGAQNYIKQYQVRLQGIVSSGLEYIRDPQQALDDSDPTSSNYYYGEGYTEILDNSSSSFDQTYYDLVTDVISGYLYPGYTDRVDPYYSGNTTDKTLTGLVGFGGNLASAGDYLVITNDGGSSIYDGPYDLYSGLFGGFDTGNWMYNGNVPLELSADVRIYAAGGLEGQHQSIIKQPEYETNIRSFGYVIAMNSSVVAVSYSAYTESSPVGCS